MVIIKKNVDRILKINKHVDGGWFWSKYSANPYIGCEHNCSYCFLRAKKYKLDNSISEKVIVRTNADVILDEELKDKRKDIIIISGYHQLEKEFKLTRKLLEVCLKHKFPVMIVTKSPLVVRDIDILKKINEASWACVVFSIASHKSKNYLEFFEPNTPTIESRFEALEKISEAGIYAGTALMPILPFITDNEDNLKLIVEETKKRKGKFILAGGLVLSDRQKKEFLNVLKDYDANLIDKYAKLYKEGYSPNDESWAIIGNKTKKFCLDNALSYRIKRYIPESPLSSNKKIAEQLFTNIYELELQGRKEEEMKFYRELAWVIDEFPTLITKVLDADSLKLLLDKPTLEDVKEFLNLLQK